MTGVGNSILFSLEVKLSFIATKVSSLNYTEPPGVCLPGTASDLTSRSLNLLNISDLRFF